GAPQIGINQERLGASLSEDRRNVNCGPGFSLALDGAGDQDLVGRRTRSGELYCGSDRSIHVSPGRRMGIAVGSVVPALRRSEQQPARPFQMSLDGDLLVQLVKVRRQGQIRKRQVFFNFFTSLQAVIELVEYEGEDYSTDEGEQPADRQVKKCFW